MCSLIKNNCWADIEWCCEHVGFVRVFAAGQVFGDPYCYALGFVVRQPKTDVSNGMIEFVCLVQVMRPCQYRAIRATIRAAGYGILSTRIKNGVSRTIEICKRGK